MADFRTGDIFSLKLTDTEHISGRIMLDVKEQCIRPRLLTPESPLGFFNGSLLVEIYRETSENLVVNPSEILIPGIFIDPHFLNSGDWTVVDHADVDPAEVEFPEALFNVGRHPHFVRGEVLLAINLSSQDVDRINAYSTIKASSTLREICLYYLGRPKEINNPLLQDVEFRSLKNSDLRFSEDRSEIYRLLGEDDNQSYYEMSSRLGHDVRRFYN